MKTYYYCNTDSFNQRTGTYESVSLTIEQIQINRFGFKTYKGRFLYEKEIDVLTACQS